MMRASLVVLCLLFSVVTASAECAWVLWSEEQVIAGDPPDIRTLWTFVRAEMTKPTCEEIRTLRLADARKRGWSVDDQGFVFPQPNRMMRYVCSPDTAWTRVGRRANEMTVNWWSVSGLICDIIGVVGAGLDIVVWTKSAPIDVIPHVPAMTRFGFGVWRPLYDSRHWIYWLLIVLGFALQLVGQFP